MKHRRKIVVAYVVADGAVVASMLALGLGQPTAGWALVAIANTWAAAGWLSTRT